MNEIDEHIQALKNAKSFILWGIVLTAIGPLLPDSFKWLIIACVLAILIWVRINCDFSAIINYLKIKKTEDWVNDFKEKS